MAILTKIFHGLQQFRASSQSYVAVQIGAHPPCTHQPTMHMCMQQQIACQQHSCSTRTYAIAKVRERSDARSFIELLARRAFVFVMTVCMDAMDGVIMESAKCALLSRNHPLRLPRHADTTGIFGRMPPPARQTIPSSTAISSLSFSRWCDSP